MTLARLLRALAGALHEPPRLLWRLADRLDPPAPYVPPAREPVPDIDATLARMQRANELIASGRVRRRPGESHHDLALRALRYRDHLKLVS